MIWVKNDSMLSVDQSGAVVLGLLDLSSAFFTQVFMACFFLNWKKVFGLTSKVIGWFLSYIKKRSQTASVKDVLLDVLSIFVIHSVHMTTWYHYNEV